MILMYMKQRSPVLVCNVDGSSSIHRMAVEMNATSCGAFNWRQWRESTAGSDSYCRIVESVTLNVIPQVSGKMNTVLIVATAVICLIGILVICGLACK